jgi:hypothetical protein
MLSAAKRLALETLRGAAQQLHQFVHQAYRGAVWSSQGDEISMPIFVPIF